MDKEEFESWQKKTESSRFAWIEDEIFRLNGRGSLYYLGGENGIFLKANTDGLMEFGDYTGAVPHIGEACFKTVAVKKCKDYNEAYEQMVSIGGLKFLIDIVSISNYENHSPVKTNESNGKTAEKSELTGMAKLRAAEREKHENPPTQHEKSDRADRKNSDKDL